MSAWFSKSRDVIFKIHQSDATYFCRGNNIGVTMEYEPRARTVQVLLDTFSPVHLCTRKDGFSYIHCSADSESLRNFHLLPEHGRTPVALYACRRGEIIIGFEDNLAEVKT